MRLTRALTTLCSMILLSCIFFAACDKDEEDTSDNILDPTRTGSLAGTVCNHFTGALVPEAIVSVDSVYMDTTDTMGEYSIEGIPSGTYVVTVSSYDFAVDVDTLSIYPGENTHNVVLERDYSKGDVTGVVRHMYTQEGIQGATIHCDDGRDVVTDMYGAFTLEDVSVDTHSFTASCDGFISWTSTILVEYGDNQLYFGLEPGVETIDKQVVYNLNEWGRLRFFDSEYNCIIDWLTINIGINDTLVFDKNDGNEGDLMYEKPGIYSDEEWRVRRWAGYPIMTITSQIRGCAWEEGDFYIYSCECENITGNDLDAYISLEIAPQLLGQYGDETVGWDDERNMMYFFKDGQYIGLSALGIEPESHIADTYTNLMNASEEEAEAYRWQKMTRSNSTDLSSPWQVDYLGSLEFYNLGEQHITDGNTFAFDFAVAFGTTENELKQAMDEAFAQYQSSF